MDGGEILNKIKSIIILIVSVILSPLMWVYSELTSFISYIYNNLSGADKNYGMLLGTILIIAITLNFAASNPNAATTDIYKYLYPIWALVFCIVSYLFFSNFTTVDNSTAMVAFFAIAIVFGAAFYFYSMGLTYPLLAIMLCGVVYAILSNLVGITAKYLLMALVSVSAIFGTALYYLSNDKSSAPTTIIYTLSGILTFATIIGLAIVFYFYSNYLKTVGGWGGFLVNFLFYVPCLVIDFINYIKNEIGSTSNVVYYLFVLEVIAALLYIYVPQIINKITTMEGTQLLPGSAFLDIKKELGSGYNLAYKNIGYADDAVTTYKRSYSISMWVYLNIQPPNYSSYAKESEIFNYGNGLPRVTYINNVDTDGSKTPDVLKVYYTNVGDEANRCYTVNIKPQKWNQIVFNYTSSQADLFINGHLEKTFVFSGNEPTYSASDIISVGSTDGLDGAICNIKYYAIPQSMRQIATSYNLLMNQNPPTNIL